MNTVKIKNYVQDRRIDFPNLYKDMRKSLHEENGKLIIKVEFSPEISINDFDRLIRTHTRYDNIEELVSDRISSECILNYIKLNTIN